MSEQNIQAEIAARAFPLLAAGNSARVRVSLAWVLEKGATTHYSNQILVEL